MIPELFALFFQSVPVSLSLAHTQVRWPIFSLDPVTQNSEMTQVTQTTGWPRSRKLLKIDDPGHANYWMTQVTQTTGWPRSRKKQVQNCTAWQWGPSFFRGSGENTQKVRGLLLWGDLWRHDRDRLLTLNKAKSCPCCLHTRSEIHRGYRQSLGLQQEPRLEKTRHGVETYKFFQNWLRVPEPRSGAIYDLSGGDKTLMGASQKWAKKGQKQKQNSFFQNFANAKSSEKNNPICCYKRGYFWLTKKSSLIIWVVYHQLLRSNGNVQAVRPQRASPRGSAQRYKKTLNHHADICRRTRD